MSTYDINNYLPYTIYPDGEIVPEVDVWVDYEEQIKNLDVEIVELQNRMDDEAVEELEILMSIKTLLTGIYYEDDE